MLDPRHLLRMARWARRPPSARQVAIVAGIVATGLMLAGAELKGWLPDFMTTPNKVAPPKITPLN
ncbi:hypothetical protein OEW28_15400 [Defluviimonas sp. WL0002]|uniref:Uncharacterized protein n=1 Tax=Albidovulum marisflavi TaxID=2984159 RepID=A0ABT2ZH09_9RHOB|nr:hypothetical protein [Defluviimonas sp. WL0002]MCV2870016.1 hypothetical protein [Defluviimonas sp. WL0002]